jgi:hypothetical protein
MGTLTRNATQVILWVCVFLSIEVLDHIIKISQTSLIIGDLVPIAGQLLDLFSLLSSSFLREIDAT